MNKEKESAIDVIKEETKQPDDLKSLIEKNLKWSQIIYEQNRKIKNRLNLMLLGSYIKLFIILIPLVLAFIYLPPLLKNVMGQYSSLLGSGSGFLKGGNQVNDILSQFSSEQINEVLKVLGNK